MLMITLVFLALYALLIGYYLYHWIRLPQVEQFEGVAPVFVSVVIAARNEETRLPHLMQSLLKQDYPSSLFEVIVVNDYSTDKTAEVFNENKNAHFHIIQPNVPPALSSKKAAIATGVQHAKGELIVVTDADCVVPATWLSSIVGWQQKTGARFIAAPVRFHYKERLVEIFQALDFMVLQGITAASVASHFHSMANGANLSYTKDAYLQVNGFEGIDKVASGDDMLLMYKIWKQYPKHVIYLKSRSAIVVTDPMPSWRAFLQQRQRWASKTLYYDDKKVLGVAAFVYLFNVWAIVLLAMSFFDAAYWWLLITFVLLKMIIELPFVAAVARFYGMQRLLIYFLLFQPLHILYTVSVGIMSQLGAYNWKGRIVK